MTGGVAGFDFRNPDYDSIYQARSARLLAIRNTPGMLAGLKEFYRDHPAEFVSDWAMTTDPRNAEIGLPVIVPFILFPRQSEFVEWVAARWRSREDGLAEKSRDMGVSWLCVAIAVWMWLHHPGVVIGFGSRKEEYVDRIGDPKSLFWKVRKVIELLPAEFRPAGYDERKHAPSMRILNPENGAAIVGEAGDNIGRGNRTSLYFVDEAAFIEHDQLIDAALSQTSNCRIDVSTPSGAGNSFYRKRQGGKVPIFRFHWRDDPRKGDDWYQEQKRKLDPVIVAQEIDIDYSASATDAFVPGALIEDAMGRGPAAVESSGRWIVGVDAAHKGDDESVIHARRSRLNLPQKQFRQLDGPQLSGAVAEWCDQLEKLGGVEAIIIELDGPGVSAYDDLRRGRFGGKVVGVHTGARVQDGRNYNVRAQIARRARDYLAQGQVSMALDAEFKTQASAMRFDYKDGLLLMQAKKDYKAKFGKSPDRWDAFVLTFCDVPLQIKESDALALPLIATSPASMAGY